jgi:hypothetical protein
MSTDFATIAPATRCWRLASGRSWCATALILTLLVSATASRASDVRRLIQTSGTLVMMIPTTDGLLVAADSRLTVAGEPRQHCDTGHKLIVDETRNAVATVTGLSTIYALDSLSSCAELARSERVMDIYGVVRAFLATHGPEGSLEALQELCLKEVLKARSIDDNTFQHFRGRDYLTVVLAHFDARSETSRFSGFVVALDNDLQPFVKQTMLDAATTDDRMTCWIFGQGEYVHSQVFNGPGSRFLDERSRRFLTPSVRVVDVSGADTLNFIRNTFKAIEAIAPTSPPPWGIGGPIDIVRLHKGGLDIIQMKPPRPATLEARTIHRSPSPTETVTPTAIASSTSFCPS